MLDHAESGELLDLGTGPLDPEGMKSWGQARTIRASVLRRLLVDDEWPVHAKGVRLRGVKVNGWLDLQAATLRCPLNLDHCYVDGPHPTLNYATASILVFTGCVLAGLSADTLTVTKDMNLAGSLFIGPLSLYGAQITGSLGCNGARLNGADASGNALVANNLKVGRDVFLQNDFTAAGAISLIGADISGNFNCEGAKLNGANATKFALLGERLKVGGSALLRNGFAAAGAISLLGADISGNLDFDGAKLNGVDGDGTALIADGLTVGQDISMQSGFTAAGGISLLGANVTGNFDCTGAKLHGPGSALVADGLTVGHDFFFQDGVTAAGGISLLGANVTGNLEWSGAKLHGHGDALVADGLTVGHDAFLDNCFTAAGGISLLGANVTGNLIWSGAKLHGVDGSGNALVADSMKVGRDVFLEDGFTAAGTISLESARIDGSLSAAITKPPGAKAGTEFHAPGMQIAHELRWVPTEPFTGPVNLEDAQVGQLEDDWTGVRGSANGYWPSGGMLRLDGFTYTRLCGDHQASAKQRLSWIQSQYLRKAATLGRESRFATQPYEQLAKVYQQGGQDKEARIIALARRQDVRQYGHLTWYRKTLNWLVDKTIKYGYQTWRAVLALAVVYVAAVMIFWAAQHHANLMVPVMNPANRPAPAALHCTSNYPCFYPAGYAIDVVIPIINVHQNSYWAPNGNAPWGGALTIFTWLGTIVGWALATLAVAGYTGLVRASDAI